MKYPHYVAKRFKNSGVPEEDLASLATVGMMKAFNTFSIDAGCKFTTYADRIMQNEILMSMRKKNPLDFADSLDEPINMNDSKKEITLLDMFHDDSKSIEQQAEENFMLDFVIDKGKDFLTDHEYTIIMVFLKDGEYNQRNMSDKLGISQSYVSRLYHKALKKIRKEIERNVTPALIKAANKKEPNIIMEIQTEKRTIEIPAGTAYEKTKYIYLNYPGLSKEEIALRLGCNKNTVSTYLSQIRKELEKDINTIDEELVIEKVVEKAIDNVSEKIEQKLPEFESNSKPLPVKPSSPGSVYLSLEDANAETIQSLLNSISATLQSGESYDLRLEVIKEKASTDKGACTA